MVRGKLLWTTYWRIVSFLVYFLILLLVNGLSQVLNNQYFSQIVDFMNSTLGIVAASVLLAFLGDLVWVLLFPMNLFAPLLHGVSAVFTLEFVLRLVDLIGRMLPLPELNQLIAAMPRYILYLVIFIIVILAEYISLFSDMAESRRPPPPYRRYERY
ncbi:hypothetical protein GF357_02190 [Candidatus Dojkabacteria bacterium]|nr:hypothetical protein [Candidatus Dojkabacteria bacterium]